MMLEGFPGHSVKNLPASERDTGSIPDLGRPPQCLTATGLARHSYGACVVEPRSHNY